MFVAVLAVCLLALAGTAAGQQVLVPNSKWQGQLQNGTDSAFVFQMPYVRAAIADTRVQC